LTTGFIGSQCTFYNSLQLHTLLQLTVDYSNCRVFLQLQLTLGTESQLLLSFSRAQDLLQTQLALTETANLRLNWLAGALGYIAREHTTKKTLPRNRPQREHGCPIVALGQTTKETLIASIVARLLVARQRS
jgi:hypothetical protein